MDRTLNLSVGMSVGLHAGAFGLYMYLVTMAPKNSTTVISNVDLLIPQPQKLVSVQASPPTAVPVPPTTWNFLRMALPQVPVSQPMQAKLPETKRQLKLPERLTGKEGKVESRTDMRMVLSQHSLALAEAASKDLSASHAPVPLAASLQLEEVGARRAPSLPPDLTMENSGLPAFRPQTLQEVKAFVAQQRSRPVQVAPLETGNAGSVASKPSALSRLAGMLSAPSLNLQGDSGGGPVLSQPAVQPALPAPLSQRKQALASSASSKPVEIVGPISHRRVVQSVVPPFPRWAKDQGILEASVSIRFYVSRAGSVLPEMQVERSSGYGVLDRLVMEALKKWVFAPDQAALEKEWGVITFRFEME